MAERPATEGGGRAPGGIALAVVLGLALAWPSIAQACAVCFGGKESNWTAGFVMGTFMMLALPPAIVLGAGIAIYRSIKRHEAELAAAEADHDPAEMASRPSSVHS